jgi:transposase
MKEDITIVGLDVHKEKTVAACFPAGAENIAWTQELASEEGSFRKLVQKVLAKGPAEFVYEAGPCGYGWQRLIQKLGAGCVVIAPGLTPVRPGDRVKTDRRDAEKLARLHRGGQLTAVHVPSPAEEAARDLLRSREDLLENRLRARHRLGKFLLRQGRVHRQTKSWGVKHQAWLRAQTWDEPCSRQTFEAYLRMLAETQTHLDHLDHNVHELADRQEYRLPVSYLRCLKGVDTLSALTLVVESQRFARFRTAREFMSYTGLTVSEYSSGSKRAQGGITRAGNAHLRRVLVEAAWSCRYPNRVSEALALRRKDCPAHVVALAQKAQDRLHRKYWKMIHRGKLPQVAVAAAARELAGFVWAIGMLVPQGKAA